MGAVAPTQAQEARLGPEALRLWVVEGAGWDQAAVSEQVTILQEAFSRCDVEMEAAASAPVAPPAEPLSVGSYGAVVPPRSQVPSFLIDVVFVKALEAGGRSLGGSSLNFAGGGVALVARQRPDGVTFPAGQTIAHEVGHLFGLDHDDTRPGLLAPGNLMRPAACRTCGFNRVQCRHIQRRLASEYPG